MHVLSAGCRTVEGAEKLVGAMAGHSTQTAKHFNDFIVHPDHGGASAYRLLYGEEGMQLVELLFLEHVL